MKIYSVHDSEFTPYGKVLNGYETEELMRKLDEVTPLPDGVEYVPSQDELEGLPIFTTIRDNAYGGMPIQLGWCNGHNTKLNCFEYHRDSELNIGISDYILLVAKVDEIVDGKLDTSKVKAFRAPAREVVEVYETTLHYAPCSAEKGAGFKVVIALPKGTNEAKPDIVAVNEEDKWLWARNKWLLAHPDTSEAKAGAYVGLVGDNIDIESDI